MIKIIACVGMNGELGYKNDLCFHIKEDMEFFKKQTMGKPVLMGYGTWLSMKEKPLEGRTNYVLTREKSLVPDTAIAVDDLESFLAKWKDSDEDLFIIGGGSVYKQTIDYADELYLTEVSATCEADTFFPKFRYEQFELSFLGSGNKDGLWYYFNRYTRIRPADYVCPYTVEINEEENDDKFYNKNI